MCHHITTHVSSIHTFWPNRGVGRGGGGVVGGGQRRQQPNEFVNLSLVKLETVFWVKKMFDIL